MQGMSKQKFTERTISAKGLVFITMLLTSIVISLLSLSVGKVAHATENVGHSHHLLAQVVVSGTPDSSDAAIHQHDHFMQAVPPLAVAPVPTGSVTALFEANLSAANEVAAPQSIATGRVIAALISDTLYLRYYVWDADKIFAAHIHAGAAGVNGPVIHTLWQSPTLPLLAPGSPITAVIPITIAQQLSQLMAGNLYVNFHSSDVPAGETRSQLRPFASTTNFMAPLLGLSEAVPITDSAAAGIARFTLVSTDTLSYEIDTTGLVDVSAAHIHRGAPGVAGDVLTAIPTDTLAATGIATGTITLTSRDLVDLLTGYLYLNIHTVQHPLGEIRGQIGGSQLFYACLNGANESPSVQTKATGETLLALEADGRTLFYRTAIRDLGMATNAHFHKGAPGQNGSVVLDQLAGGKVLSDSSAITGSETLTPAQVIDLITGHYYVNVHSAKEPNGELRGQVLPFVAPSHMMATLTGKQQVPAVATNAVGLARFKLDPFLDRIYYTLLVTDIAGITSAHIHRGAKDSNGTVLAELYTSGGTDIFSPSDPIGGGVAMSGREWVQLISGEFYINVHSIAFGNGEIRGQIGGPQVFEALLTGVNESPPLSNTLASGKALLALSSDTTMLDYRLFVANIPTITLAHIHRGAAGVTGPPIATLSTLSGTFSAANPLSGTAYLNPAQVLDLIAGRLYLNVHTTANSSGEVRDQIRPLNKMQEEFLVAMSGAQAGIALPTSGRGEASLRLLPELGLLHYTLAVTNVADITQAHIHVGVEGKSGNIVHHLFQASDDDLFDTSHPLAGCLYLTSADLVNLYTGYWYLNVHTVNSPNGALRGQVVGRRMAYLPVVYKN